MRQCPDEAVVPNAPEPRGAAWAGTAAAHAMPSGLDGVVARGEEGVHVTNEGTGDLGR